MSRRPNRPRRVVSERQLAALKALGFRYSVTREAWVHRVAGGRVGPVFVERGHVSPDGVPDEHLYQAMTTRRRPRLVPEHERTPLPRRGAQPEISREVIPVEVSLRADEPPRVVQVDGRPPVRGIDPAALRKADGVVVPIRKAATA